MALAESGNLLLIGNRAVDQNDWAKWARALATSAVAAGQAALAHDVDKLADAGNAVYETCDGCHMKYMAARADEQKPAG
jgi:hypothetical protein